jgi:hypothetical protein
VDTWEDLDFLLGLRGLVLVFWVVVGVGGGLGFILVTAAALLEDIFLGFLVWGV